MFKKCIVFFLLLFPVLLFSQVKPKKGLNPADIKSGSGQLNNVSSNRTANNTNTSQKDSIATIDQYKIITLERDTTFVDTSLTLLADYKANYLRKDNFGLLQFPNEGQPYNVQDYGLTKYNPFPEFGFKAKHYAYLQVDDINYYNVATPFTDLFYRSVLEQGQILDAFLTLNTSENLNFSVGYKGLRSMGKYLNSISSNGNLRLISSYHTKDRRYHLNVHFTAQDFSNQENGGINDISLFESGEDPYTDREQMDVYLRDATSLLKGSRYFLDHTFRLSKNNPNSIVLHHQFNYENKSFEFTQPTVSDKFGDAYTSSIKNKTRYNRMYNKLGAGYSNETLGAFEFYIEDFSYNYYYNRIILNNDGSVKVPNALNDRINTYGARYTYHKNKLKASILFSNSITDQSLANIDASARYTLDNTNSFSFRYQNMNKLPDNNYTLYQSDYLWYNWYNQFKNEKINSFEAEARTKWLNLSAQYTVLKDHLYFSNDYYIYVEPDNAWDVLQVTPKQYANTINYFSVKASKEFKFWKLALDNTLLYQQVDQKDNVLNVPDFITRNTLYYSEYLFKKALFLQTGITFQYFTKYYGDDYNPLLGEFYSQDKRKFGDFPMFDFFINAKIRQFRVFLKAEHFNSSFTGYDFYSAPNYPYRDFTVRFGVIWDFFS